MAHTFPLNLIDKKNGRVISYFIYILQKKKYKKSESRRQMAVPIDFGSNLIQYIKAEAFNKVLTR